MPELRLVAALDYLESVLVFALHAGEIGIHIGVLDLALCVGLGLNFPLQLHVQHHKQELVGRLRTA